MNMNLMLYLSGCATFKPSTIIGASIGATAGSIAGTMIGSPKHSVNGAFIGASAGAAAGGLAGFIFGEVTSTNQTTTNKLPRIDADAETPSISRPEVSCIEVPSRIDGNKYYKKHEVCTIEKGAIWMME